MGEFIGEVKPLYNRWTWPLRVMKPGDYFIVDKALRSAEEVRNLMSVRASQLGIRVSVTKHPEDHPGFTKVEIVDLNKPEEKPDGLMMDFETAGQKLQLWYGIDINALPYGTFYSQGRAEMLQPQIVEPSVKRGIVDVPGTGKLGMMFDPDGVRFEVLPAHSTIASWKPLRIDDVMS